MAQSTVAHLVNHVKVTGSLSDRPCSGAPHVMLVRQDNFIRHVTSRHLHDKYLMEQSTADIIAGNRGQRISHNTVQNRLRNPRISCSRPYHGPILTRCQRLDVSSGQETIVDWFFGDESCFNISNAHNECYADNCVFEHDRFGGRCVMVWVAINHNFKFEFLIVN